MTNAKHVHEKQDCTKRLKLERNPYQPSKVSSQGKELRTVLTNGGACAQRNYRKWLFM